MTTSIRYFTCRHGSAAFGLLLWIGVTGCGTQLVDSGTSSQTSRVRDVQPPVAIGSPKANTGAERVDVPRELRDVPRVSASSVVSLPERTNQAYYHEVAAGETVTSIARRYRVSVEKVVQVNGLDATAQLKPGQLLAIPQ
jgi:LysM repeat protein